MTKIDRFRLSLIVLGIFLFGFSFIFVLYVGLPVDFSADYLQSAIRTLDTISYSQLIKATLNPLTPGWFYPPHGMMEYMRPVTILLFQVLHRLLPYSLLPFQIVASISHGLLTVLLFGLIYFWTKRVLLGCFAVLLYTSFPSNFSLMHSILSTDYQYVVSILDICAFLLLFSLSVGKFKTKSSFIMATFFWVLATWLVIKIKSSEKILPFIYLGFLIIRFKFIAQKIGLRRCFVLFLLMMAMMLMVIPLKSHESWLTPTVKQKIEFTTSKKDARALSFHWKNSLQRTFFVFGGEFPFTTVFRKRAPRSFTENLGFCLAWFFWLGLIVMPFILAQQKKEDTPNNYAHFYWLFLMWFVAIIAGFSSGADLFDLRFVNFAYIPAIPVLFMMAHTFKTVFFEKKHCQLFYGVLVLILIYTIGNNFVILMKQIRHFGGMQSVSVRAERDVFHNFYGKPPVEAQLYERHQELIDRVMVIDWYDLPSDWLFIAKNKLRQEKVAYFFTDNANSDKLKQLREANLDIQLWKTYNLLDAEPLIFNIFRMTQCLRERFSKRRKRYEIFIYRVTEKNASV